MNIEIFFLCFVQHLFFFLTSNEWVVDEQAYDFQTVADVIY